ncbi:MAG: VapC toxin family PIN domain ribonuclease [Candidatus Methylomirabilota bacterium]|nr:type II toxin-antitoxin system VapC family toxin [candidate division NC10 bacterium]PWB46558.1 MAG: VapC toxin family PIN domain ribonuclease [candidate division NC10 bacterium]
MRPTYLLDTDWVIHYLNGRTDIVEEIDRARNLGLALSVVSLAELYEGVHYSRDPEGNEQSLQDFLADVEVIGVDEAICRIFGWERGKLRQRGKAIGDFDLLIAATCLHNGFTLLTNNRRHFDQVENLAIVSI